MLMNVRWVFSRAFRRALALIFKVSPKNRLHTLLFFTLVFTATPAVGQITWGDWQYSINGNNVIITRYTGRSGDLSIPSTINGLPVQYINVGAFSGNTSITNAFV